MFPRCWERMRAVSVGTLLEISFADWGRSRSWCWCVFLEVGLSVIALWVKALLWDAGVLGGIWYWCKLAFFFFFSLLMKFEVHFIAPALPSRAARGMGRWGCGSLSLGLAVGPGGMLVGCSAGSFAGSVYALLYERIFNKFSSYRWLGREGLCLEVLDGTRRGCIAVLWLVCACVLCWWVCGAPSTRWIVPSVLTE